MGKLHISITLNQYMNLKPNDLIESNFINENEINDHLNWMFNQ
jgi:hypothetical protein